MGVHARVLVCHVHVTLALQVSDTGDYLGTLADWFPEVSRDDVVSRPLCVLSRV